MEDSKTVWVMPASQSYLTKEGKQRDAKVIQDAWNNPSGEGFKILGEELLRPVIVSLGLENKTIDSTILSKVEKAGVKDRRIFIEAGSAKAPTSAELDKLQQKIYEDLLVELGTSHLLYDTPIYAEAYTMEGTKGWCFLFKSFSHQDISHAD